MRDFNLHFHSMDDLRVGLPKDGQVGPVAAATRGYAGRICLIRPVCCMCL